MMFIFLIEIFAENDYLVLKKIENSIYKYELVKAPEQLAANKKIDPEILKQYQNLAEICWRIARDKDNQYKTLFVNKVEQEELIYLALETMIYCANHGCRESFRELFILSGNGYFRCTRDADKLITMLKPTRDPTKKNIPIFPRDLTLTKEKLLECIDQSKYLKLYFRYQIDLPQKRENITEYGQFLPNSIFNVLMGYTTFTHIIEMLKSFITDKNPEDELSETSSVGSYDSVILESNPKTVEESFHITQANIRHRHSDTKQKPEE